MRLLPSPVRRNRPDPVPDPASALLQVVVLEDDPLLRDHILLPRLADHGFGAIGLGSAADLERLLLQEVPDIVVLDVGLPDADGFAVAQSLRNRHPGIGVVMLTGRQDPADRVRGLVDGADAYLTKPVDVSLLAATLHSLWRRLRAPRDTPGPPLTDGGDDVIHAGGWRLDCSGWRLQAPDGKAIALTRSERPLLLCLLRQAGDLVRREALISSLTDNVFDFDTHRLDSLVHRLRRKVATQCDRPLPLVAVHGEGYVFMP